jgi:acyl carrier protein
VENRIKEIILQIMEEQDELTVIEPQLSSNLIANLGLDSFSLAVLTVQIEDEFGVDIFKDEFPQTIQEILDILNR